MVAGYPWFGAWSRDTMLSYEGLFLATGRAAEGRELLRAVRGHAVPGHAGEHRRHRPDGVQHRRRHALVPARGGRHVATTGDVDLAAELLPALREVVDHHLEGTRYGIRADPADGLLRQGAPARR